MDAIKSVLILVLSAQLFGRLFILVLATIALALGRLIFLISVLPPPPPTTKQTTDDDDDDRAPNGAPRRSARAGSRARPRSSIMIINSVLWNALIIAAIAI